MANWIMLSTDDGKGGVLLPPGSEKIAEHLKKEGKAKDYSEFLAERDARAAEDLKQLEIFCEKHDMKPFPTMGSMSMMPEPIRKRFHRGGMDAFVCNIVEAMGGNPETQQVWRAGAFYFIVNTPGEGINLLEDVVKVWPKE